VLKAGLESQALDLLREEGARPEKLSHPNIVDVHSVNLDGTKLYVVMEYLEGKPLNALLDEDLAVACPSVALADHRGRGGGAGYAHDHSVIHSDLKPANVFCDDRGEDEAARLRDCADFARSSDAQAFGATCAHARLCQLRDA